VKENMKIYFPNGSYKTLHLTGDLTADGVVKPMAEKLNMPLHYSPHLEIIEIKKEESETIRELKLTF
jgi:hypothetical protein